jgi:hypothetical protein
MEVKMKELIKLRNSFRALSDQVKKLYSRHFIGKLIVTIIILFILIGAIYYIPVLSVKANALPETEYSGLSKAGKEITHDPGDVLVAESESKCLYVDGSTMNLKVVDKNTKKVWNALVPGASNTSEKALINVSYLGEDNNLREWDSYTYCTQLGAYTIRQITDGVQIAMNINEGESERFNEYYPEKMSPDRFENFFLGGITKLVDSGQIDQTTGDRYKTTLQLIYRKSITEDCYAVSMSGTPPRSAVRQLIELGKLLGYTRDMLIEDCNAMGLTVTFVEPASFNITLEAVLNGDDFVIRIPTQEMTSSNAYYKIQNIEVLPSFGAAAAEDYKDGYIFVPDGAGALFRFNTFNAAIPEYQRPVYDNDYFKDYYYMPEYSDELMMPVFGMIYGEAVNSDHGFLAIIERGAETSYIDAKLASTSKDNPAPYNKVFASFDVTQYTNVKVYGPFSDNAATYLADSGKLSVDYSIRYKLFPGTVTYFDMAKAYQAYLQQQWNISEFKYPDKAKLYLDFIGTISLTKRFIGIPSDAKYSMTTYRELSDIIKDLGDTGLALQYSGFFNGGFENKLNNRADLAAANGSEKDLNKLRKLAESKNTDLFFETSLSKIYDSGNGFSKKTHTIYDYSNSPAEIYRYSPAIGIFNGWIGNGDTYHYYLLSPRYLEGVVDAFLKDAKDYDKLSVTDLAYYNYPDYRFNKKISIYQADAEVDKNLKKLASEKELSLYNPMMKDLVYGTYAEDISRESSDYATMYSTIPFRQLVMNGLIQVTTEDVNMSSKNCAYYILQAVELGVYPKFTLTAKSDDILKDSAYDYYYATEYAKQKDTISQVYSACKSAWDEIGTMQITNHTILQDNVFCTEYASGVSVITNYNLEPVAVDGKEIPALGYLLVKE